MVVCLSLRTPFRLRGKDSDGYDYLVRSKGIGFADAAVVASFFAGNPITDTDAYENYSGILQTSNPNLAHLNNTIVIVEGQGSATSEDGNSLFDITILVFDDDRNLFSDDSSSD